LFKFPNTKTKHRLRNINIAIAYHNTPRTLSDVGKEFSLSPERVRQSHNKLVRHVSRCMKLNDIYFYEKKINHCPEMARILTIYKDLFEENELKTEITINDDDGCPAIILSNCQQDGFVDVHICDENTGANVSIEDLKMALRKLSAK